MTPASFYYYCSSVKLGNLSAKYLLRKALTKDKSMGAKIKDNKPATLKPATKIEANQKQKPLTIKENAPKLKILRGKDSKAMTGLTPVLTIPIPKAAIKAAGKLAKFTPGNIISTTKRLRAVANKVKSELIIIFLIGYNFLCLCYI